MSKPLIEEITALLGPKFLGDINLDEALEKIESHLINKALDQTHGELNFAARVLGISFRSLRYRMQKHGIEV